jgi:hypothetical protein
LHGSFILHETFMKHFGNKQAGTQDSSIAVGRKYTNCRFIIGFTTFYQFLFVTPNQYNFIAQFLCADKCFFFKIIHNS